MLLYEHSLIVNATNEIFTHSNLRVRQMNTHGLPPNESSLRFEIKGSQTCLCLSESQKDTQDLQLLFTDTQVYLFSCMALQLNELQTYFNWFLMFTLTLFQNRHFSLYSVTDLFVSK